MKKPTLKWKDLGEGYWTAKCGNITLGVEHWPSNETKLVYNSYVYGLVEDPKWSSTKEVAMLRAEDALRKFAKAIAKRLK